MSLSGFFRTAVEMTLKASPLSNRSVRRTCGLQATKGKHSKGVPQQADGRPLQGR